MPFSPNISKISAEIETSRATVLNYLGYLKNARLINLLFSNTGPMDSFKNLIRSIFTIPIYCISSLLTILITGIFRLTFFYNQVGYQNKRDQLPVNFDFKVNNE